MFNDEMLTIEEVAEFLKLKPQTIYKWAQTGKIPGAKFGKEWRFRRSVLEKWIDERISTSRNSNSTSGPRKGSTSSSKKKKKSSTRRSPGSGPEKN